MSTDEPNPISRRRPRRKLDPRTLPPEWARIVRYGRQEAKRIRSERGRRAGEASGEARRARTADRDYWICLRYHNRPNGTYREVAEAMAPAWTVSKQTVYRVVTRNYHDWHHHHIEAGRCDCPGVGYRRGERRAPGANG